MTRSVGLALALCLVSSATCAQPKSEVAFTIPEKDLIPEGIAYDSTTKTFYVSSTYKRKIVSIDSLGTIRDFTQAAQDGLWGVLGMRVDAERKLLWVVSSHAGLGMPMQEMHLGEEGRSAVFKYDTETGTLIKKYLLSPNPDAHFLNDLVVTTQGDVFITDSGGQAIYTISHQRDSLELFLALEDVGSPNGIALSDNERFLFFPLWSKGDVGRIDISNRDFSLLDKPTDLSVQADGIYFYQQSLITVEPYNTAKVINRYHISDDYGTIEKQEIIEADHPLLMQPTTGVLIGDQFYFIANSQLQVFRRLYEEHGDEYRQDQLQNVVVLKVSMH